MRLFGLEITRHQKQTGTFASVPSSRGGWWPIVRESFPGAWQRNIEVRTDDVLGYATVYACISLIAADIAKLRLRLVELDANGIWTEVDSPSFSPVLRKPNRYQNRIKFIEQWVTSKLIHGNTYVVKQRDARGVVIALYILDPLRTKPLVAQDGSVFYQLYRDNLSGLEDERLIVPASEIIHDIMSPIYHPLCGVSPIFACGLAAYQGVKIQNHSTHLFANNAAPGGILSAPGFINPETAQRIKEHWDDNYGGANAGKVAVLGDGLKFEAMTINPVDAQLIEQLKWSAEQVCAAFHVPAYKVGVAPPPAYNNIEALNQEYYATCLQQLIESIELCLDEGLGLDTPKESRTYGTEFDLDGLLRMDTATKAKVALDAQKAGLEINEVRKRYFDLGPVEGGDSVYLQEQNWPLRLLADRELPTRPPTAPAPIEPPAATDEGEDDDADTERAADQLLFEKRQFELAA